jgi:hypothetical protein
LECDKIKTWNFNDELFKHTNDLNCTNGNGINRINITQTNTENNNNNLLGRSDNDKCRLFAVNLIENINNTFRTSNNFVSFRIYRKNNNDLSKSLSRSSSQKENNKHTLNKNEVQLNIINVKFINNKLYSK